MNINPVNSKCSKRQINRAFVRVHETKRKYMWWLTNKDSFFQVATEGCTIATILVSSDLLWNNDFMKNIHVHVVLLFVINTCIEQYKRPMCHIDHLRNRSNQ